MLTHSIPSITSGGSHQAIYSLEEVGSVRVVGIDIPKRRISGINRFRNLPLIMLASKISLDGDSSIAQ